MRRSALGSRADRQQGFGKEGHSATRKRPGPACERASNLRTGERLCREVERGAAEGIRTPDPRITNAVLYRLSYRGKPSI